MENILLIDGNSIMNRAFYALLNAGMFRSQEGIYTNAIYGFLNIFFKAVEDYSPEYILVAFDKGKSTFRHKKYKEYKAGRSKMPEELKMQMPIIKEIISAMNIKFIEMDEYEADDILGTISKKMSSDTKKVYILTGDRDYFQLIDKNINIIYPKSSKNESIQELWDEKKIKENYEGLNPKDLIEIKALMGDTSDNIPGVRGIGEKTAIKLILEYRNIDNLYEKVEKDEDSLTLKQKEKIITDKENAFLSRELGEIVTNIDLNLDLEEIRKKEWSPSLKDIFIKLNFKSFLDRFEMEDDDKNINLPKVKKDISNLDLGILNKGYVFFSAIFKEEFDEKGKKIKEKDISVMDKKIDKINLYIPSIDKNIYSLDLENENRDNNIKIIKSIFEDEKIEKIGFATKDTNISLKNIGIDINNLYVDLKLAEYLINPSLGKYMLEDVSSKYISPSIVSKLNSNKEYAPYIIFEIHEYILDKINEMELRDVLFRIEMPILKILVKMSFLGIKVEKEKIEKFGKELEEKISKLEKEIHTLAGEEYNINSTKQTGEILFEKLKLPVIKKTKTGYSTDAKILEKLKERHEIIGKILEYREISKLLSTYINGFLPYIRKEDGRVHGRFHQTVTRTGRISSSDPNLQNIPIKTEQAKVFRESFIPKEGYVFVDSDYSQIELRVLAHIADDKKMIKAFKEGEDIHRSTAAHILNKDISEVTDIERSRAKAVNFGIIYGISSFGLSEQIKVSIKEAQEYINEYLDKYEGIARYMKEVVEFAKKDGYVTTLFGRKRDIHEIYSTNFNIREFGKRVAMNTPIQGTAADIVKLAMINVDKKLKEEKIDGNIVLQIHDEILLEVKEGQEEKAAKILKEEMENIINLKVPLIADTKIGKNWLM